ncbi:LacI family DNA-binding transcriptional regulator [Saccharopolyspora sp. TS4A08]|uniref:LacI family DNA-binding transcriptional regulator n=1 Tax=Saccharopolyspora ipomoeae TaxID=3042027 RepID=A0ABT6PMW1_9PSEU|nr:LacI family DNA-binding transcriptional regulator [Saccharopolyspora sp. TS4A08]MDI2029354.1 LacI family DNA-binding transcriptional regulator [Saccharopolyspora sp. TS4A08]
MTTKEHGRVSIKEVAERAGVSIGTVSNVVNRPDRVAASTRDRVQAAIDALGYVRSESARHLRAGSSRMIAMLALDMTNPFFAEVAHGAEEIATARGLGVMQCSSGQDAEVESLYLSLFAEQRVRGVLIAPAAAGSVEVLARQGIPHVVVDGSADGAACSVSVDDVLGGELAVGHLVGAGHDRIACVTGPLHLPQCRDRRLGGARAAELAVLEVPTMDVAGGRDAGSRLLGMPDRPSAVFCANDLLALGVLQALFAAGLRVPDDIALVGYDDIEFASAAAVPLTSVRRPARRLGRTAADLLLRESGETDHSHEHVVYQPELVVRRSSLPLR